MSMTSTTTTTATTATEKTTTIASPAGSNASNQKKKVHTMPPMNCIIVGGKKRRWGCCHNNPDYYGGSEFDYCDHRERSTKRHEDPFAAFPSMSGSCKYCRHGKLQGIYLNRSYPMPIYKRGWRGLFSSFRSVQQHHQTDYTKRSVFLQDLASPQTPAATIFAKDEPIQVDDSSYAII
ncbi:hypothetical protein BCR43DRAFT_499180 [Syncephalastrum racemosum]|uniref:Uncharacterized protein n=1 Tax=Syncephalastrum racemosum TaxID=13706 RepID=A0A1X2GZX1_SYNRA|nr:hypothetical protein BCR43DRAFT_499180 [Syncephalastrum racemosum]